MISWQEYEAAFALEKFFPDTNSRFLTHKSFTKQLKSFSDEFNITAIGKSEKGKSIHKIAFGYGPKKVLIWSQMHGNESTGTFAILDLLQLLHQNFFLKKQIEDHFTVVMIPMVNPDGADAFERRNASGIDINRDALAKQAPETRVLMKQIEIFEPHIAFNLHDQRSIFSVGENIQPATISFCIPSFDKTRAIDATRALGMDLIGKLWQSFPEDFKTKTGRYTDEFYPTAFGDNIQKTGINCVLFEAGAHFNDPKRIAARTLFGFSILQAFKVLLNQKNPTTELYQSIPENEQKMRDIIVKQVKLNSRGRKLKVDLIFKLKEEVKGSTFYRYLKLDDIGDFQFLNALQVVDGKGAEFNIQEMYLGKTFEFQEFQQTFWEGVIV